MAPVYEAQFIAAPVGPAGCQAPYVRRELCIGDGLVRATLRVSALGLIEAHVNGAVVGDAVLEPGWTSYRHRLVVRAHDVTAALRPGPNALGAMLGEGWAVGRVGYGAGHLAQWSERPAGFLQLELEYADRTETVASDGTWRWATGAVGANGIYDGEDFDARLEPRGWDTAGFDDSSWAPVEVLGFDTGALIEPEAPPIRRITERAGTVLQTPAGRTVVDFGQNFSGWVRLRGSAPAGTTVTLHTCETLIDGESDFETNRLAKSTDRYTFRGDDVETWEPRFTFHGFRYVDVEGWVGELDASAFTGVVIHSDLDRTGWFECSDELVNQFHANVVWSWRGNTVGIPTDCPQRDERLGWTGDINAFASTASFLYDTRTFLSSWLADLAAEQTRLGSVPLVVPSVPIGMPAGPTALWADVAVSLPWQLYIAYGDASILERQYSSMTALADEVAAALSPQGLWDSGFQFGDWVDPDAPPDNPAKSKANPHLVATAYAHRTFKEMASASEVLGHADDVVRYRALAVRVAESFRHEWVTEAGLLANECPTSYALAVCFGLLDPDQERRAGRRLAQLVSERGYCIATGFAGTPYVTVALDRTGQLDAAYRVLRATKCPSFLYPVTMGATTIWERWDAIKPDGSLNATGMTSLNHYALGAMADWLHTRVAGLAPTSPGYRTIRVAPQPGGGLTHASARLRTPRGMASVAWRIERQRHVTLKVTVPPDTIAEVVLPRHPDATVVSVGAGDHSWSYEIPLELPPRFGLDSPMKQLAADADAWAAFVGVLQRHIPGTPDLDPAMADQLDGTLRSALGLSDDAPMAMDFTSELGAAWDRLMARLEAG
jgi:alpha-L-rhamnosidase